jgi:S-formylglutathione hydrolase FrmB
VFALHIYVGDSLTLAWPMKQVMEKAHKADSAKDVIVVLPNGDNKGFGTWYLNNPATGDWETHIARELVKYVDDHFRTIPQGASRGIMGCSNGGSGAMHLALKYPDAFGAVASLSGVYDWANHPWLHFLIDYFATRPPKDFDEIRKRSGLDWRPAAMIVLAVETLPDPNKPPLYVDLPFKAVNGQGQLDAEAWSKASALDPLHDAQRYAKEDPRLRGILVTAGSLEQAVLAAAQDFDKVLTDLGIAHDFVETDGCGCDCDGFDFAPAFQYITAHLAFK